MNPIVASFRYIAILDTPISESYISVHRLAKWLLGEALASALRDIPHSIYLTQFVARRIEDAVQYSYGSLHKPVFQN